MELPQTYEPITSNRLVERLVSSLIYSGLMRKTYGEDENGHISFDYVPVMASDFWPVDGSGKRVSHEESSLHWQFKLKPDIFWVYPDGMKKRFAAGDVKYTADVINNLSTKNINLLNYFCFYRNY